MFVGLKSWRRLEWSCRSSSGREKVVYSSWSSLVGGLGDREDRVNLIGSGNLPFSNC